MRENKAQWGLTMISVIDWQLAHQIVTELPHESLERSAAILLAATEMVRQRQREEESHKAPRRFGNVARTSPSLIASSTGK